MTRTKWIAIAVLTFPMNVATTRVTAAVTLFDAGMLSPGFVSSAGPGGYLSGISSSGQLVGYNVLATSHYRNHAFRTSPGGTIATSADLGTLDGLSTSSSYADGINDSGQVVGYSTFAGGADAFRTPPNGAMNSSSDLGNLGASSQAWSINASGQVCGFSYLSAQSQSFHAFRTTAGGKINAASDLGTLGGSNSSAKSINASGQVAGESEISGDLAYHAFRTTSTGGITTASDLGTLGGLSSQATAINASGQVAGTSQTVDGSSHAFRTTANGIIDPASDLGTLGGTTDVDAINTAGQVVGLSYTSDGDPDAYIDDPNAGMIDLNSFLPADSDWHLTEATGINDNGQLCGYGDLDGVTHGFMLSGVFVPEPTAFGIAAAAAFIAIPRQRRRTRR